MRSALAPLLALALTTACESPISDNEDLGLEGHGVATLGDLDHVTFTGAQPLLAGTRVCGALRCRQDCPDDGDDQIDLSGVEVPGCFSRTAEGAASMDGSGCLVVDADAPSDAPVRWVMQPLLGTCPYAEQGYPARGDAFDFRVAAREDVNAVIDLFPERYAALDAARDEPRYRLIDQAALPPDHFPSTERVHFAAGVPLRVPVGLVDDSGAPVAFTREDARAVYEVTRPAASRESLTFVEEEIPRPLAPLLVLGPGAEVAVSLEVDGVTYPAGTVVATPADALGSVQLIGFIGADPNIGPLDGIRALVRHREGALVFGVPLAWTVHTGGLDLSSLAMFTGRHEVTDISATVDAPYGAYVSMRDDCRPPEARAVPMTVQIEAAYAGVRGQAAFTFSGPPAEPWMFREEWRPAAGCRGPEIAPPRPAQDPPAPPRDEVPPAPEPPPDDPGCGCGQATSAPSGARWIALALGLLALGRRALPRR